MNSREFSRLAMSLIDEEEKIRELELRTTAAVIIQSFWRQKIISVNFLLPAYQKKSTRFGHFGGFLLDFPIFRYW